MAKDYLKSFIEKHKDEIVAQLKDGPFALNKKCDLCGFVCMQEEHICRECNGYRFVPIKEGEKPIFSVELHDM